MRFEISNLSHCSSLFFINVMKTPVCYLENNVFNERFPGKGINKKNINKKANIVLKVIVLILSALSSLSAVSKSLADNKNKINKPKLVVQITVDQLRGDLPLRVQQSLPLGGFRYLLEQGTYYKNAHYGHANTETAVGHATLVTGADPSRHGIVANDWINSKTGQYVYNTEDEKHHILNKKIKKHAGVSPRNLLSSTIGDELVLSNAGKSRVFSISGKDRGAILPGGHAGKAFWYSKSDGKFVTSSYYYEQYPKWVSDWNASTPAERFRGKQWGLIRPKETYIAKAIDDRPYEADFKSLGRTFPHNYGDDKYLNLLVGLTPAVDELTLEFTKLLIQNEKPGAGEFTDYLAVSFSATDYVGHMFGPSSLESEDNLYRLDRILASFFKFLDKKMGLENILIVLSSDHGAPEAPEYVRTLGMSVGRFAFDYFKTDNPLTIALKNKYGRDDLILSHSHPYFYLNYKAIRQINKKPAEVENFIASEVIKLPGIYYAMTSSQLLTGQFVNSVMQRQIRRNFHPERSGAIHLVPDQYWFLHSTDEAAKMGLDGVTAIHGSPWSYDTYVPVFFAGHRVSAQVVGRYVETVDIAPTLASYLDIKMPSGAVGAVLEEVTAVKR